MSVVVIGLSHRTSPVELRERFAFAEAAIPGALRTLRESGVATEAAILSTCNRVEIYAATSLAPERAFAELKKKAKPVNVTVAQSAAACHGWNGVAR